MFENVKKILDPKSTTNVNTIYGPLMFSFFSKIICQNNPSKWIGPRSESWCQYLGIGVNPEILEK